MAEMTIRLRINPETGKKDIVIGLRSEPDALPHEHEQQHRQLVDRLIEGGAITAGEVGELVVEREQEHSAWEAAAGQSDQTRPAEQEGNQS